MFGRLKSLFSDTEKASPAASADKTPDTDTGQVAPQDSKPEAFLRREPVFDRRGRLIARIFDLPPDAGLSNRQFLELLAAQPAGWNNAPALIPVAGENIDLPAVDRLSGPNFGLLLQLDSQTRPETLIARLNTLQERGTAIGVIRHPEHPLFAEVVGLADLACVSSHAQPPEIVRSFSAAIRASEQQRPIRLLATDIETPDDYRFCHQWHYEWFHGPFASDMPPSLEQAGADPQKLLLMNLLRLVQGDAETAEIARTMKQDPLLSFRILRYLNSPLIGLSQPIDSINHALTILGRQRLTRWLSVLLFSVREPGLGDWLLVESALTRGRLMEVLGSRDDQRHGNDELFMTGIFSCLDRLLRRPLPEILGEIPVSPRIRQALLERTGPYANLLAIAEAGERFDLPLLESATQSAGLNSNTVNQAVLAATAWASEVTGQWE